MERREEGGEEGGLKICKLPLLLILVEKGLLTLRHVRDVLLYFTQKVLCPLLPPSPLLLSFPPFATIFGTIP